MVIAGSSEALTSSVTLGSETGSSTGRITSSTGSAVSSVDTGSAVISASSVEDCSSCTDSSISGTS